MKHTEMVKIAIVLAIVYFVFVKNGSSYNRVHRQPVQTYAYPRRRSTYDIVPDTPPKSISTYESGSTNLLSAAELIGLPDMLGGSRRNMSRDIRGDPVIAPISEVSGYQTQATIPRGVPTIAVGSSIMQDPNQSRLTLQNPFYK